MGVRFLTEGNKFRAIAEVKVAGQIIRVRHEGTWPTDKDEACQMAWDLLRGELGRRVKQAETVLDEGGVALMLMGDKSPKPHVVKHLPEPQPDYTKTPTCSEHRWEWINDCQPYGWYCDRCREFRVGQEDDPPSDGWFKI